MSSHIDAYTDNSEDKSGDSETILGQIVTKVNWKMGIFIFIIGILIFSDVFVNNILTRFNDSEDMGCPNNKGTLIQMGFLVCAYWVSDGLIRSRVI